MELPFVLAGPVLRRVEPRAVAVWVALSRPAAVSLVVWEGVRKSGTAGAPVARSEPTAALRMGAGLFVSLAVAQLPSPAVPLQPGVNYAYDLTLQAGDESDARTLASEGLLGRVAGLPAQAWASDQPLGYDTGFLPSFALPPAELTDLRLVYGSCRRPANDHFDAMPWVDTLVQDAFKGQSRADGAPLAPAALARPHQLYLGGDQIYADDLSPLHLRLCQRLAHRLISGTDTPQAPLVEHLQATGRLVATGSSHRFPESLLLGRGPAMDGDAVDRTMVDFPATLAAFPAGGRFDLTQFDARFTSTDGDSHLLSFGEFAGMYLSVFSDRFWDTLHKEEIAAVLRPPDTASDAAVPLFSRSLLDPKAAAWFKADRWTAWNGMQPVRDAATGDPRPRDPRRFADCFAAFMIRRMARADLAGGFDGFRRMVGDPDILQELDPALRGELSPDAIEAMEDLQAKQAAFFRAFMHQLQGRVMRGLVRRFGIARLADVDCPFSENDRPPGFTGTVLMHGPVAILAEARRRDELFEKGGDDLWRRHLESLLATEQLAWPQFVTACLQRVEPTPWPVPAGITLDAGVTPPEPADVADADLETLQPGLIARLAQHWADDPQPDQRASFKDEGYTNLSLTSLARAVAEFATDHVWRAYRSLHGQFRQLQAFALGQSKVRRALANVPTYMIFDDHDVTDDWNLNPVWCERVLKADGARPQPLGRQVLRNALASYAVFQDWGNDLVRYAPGTPGQDVLTQVSRLFAADSPRWPAPAAAAELDRLFGLDQLPLPQEASRPHGRHRPVDAPMAWHYRVEGPQFVVTVLDNRTRRSFATRFGPPGNVGATMLESQIPRAPMAAGKQVLIVVAPLQVLAPSVFDEIVAPGAYRAFDLDAGAGIGSGRGGEGMPGLNPDAIESWALDAVTFEALLALLAPHRQVVILSGDVHNSTATQMSYWRKGVAQPSRIVQFTSSGIKNVMPSYLTLIDQSLSFAQELIRADIGGDRLGWLDGADGAFDFPPGRSPADVPLVLRKRIPQRPAHLPVHGWPVDAARPAGDPARHTRVRADRRPDFSWSLRPVFDLRPDTEPTTRPAMARPVPFTGTPPTAANLEAGGQSAFLAYAQVARRHFRQLDRLGHARQILFRSSIARVVFARRQDGSGTDARIVLEAVHEVLSALPDPLNRAVNPHLLVPEVVMEQRAEMTPPADAVRPEDRPLNGPLATSIVERLRALG